MSGCKQRPWRTLRCVVEVKVPPSNYSDEKDLIYHVERSLFQHGKFPGLLPMPRSHHPERYDAKPKVKSFVRVVEQQRREREAEIARVGGEPINAFTTPVIGKRDFDH